MNYNEIIQEIRCLLFSGKLTECHKKIIDVLPVLESIADDLAEEERKVFNSAINNLIFALQNSDYLLATDILKFEVSLFVKEE